MSQKLRKNQAEGTAKGAFEDQVELFAMGMQSCSCKLDRPAYMRLRKRRSGSEVRVISAATELVDHGEFYFDGIVVYELTVRENKGSDAAPLRIECIFQAHFHGPKLIVRSEAERFLQSYFKIISWPYFRQFVSDMTARMAVAPLLLPLLPEGKAG